MDADERAWPRWAGVKPTRTRVLNGRCLWSPARESRTFRDATLEECRTRRKTVVRLRPLALIRPAANALIVRKAVLPTTLCPTIRTPQPLTEIFVFCLNVLPFQPVIVV